MTATNSEILAEADRQVREKSIPDGPNGSLARTLMMLRANGFDIVVLRETWEADR